MKKLSKNFLLMASLVLILYGCEEMLSTAPSNDFDNMTKGVVTYVTDGDTFTVQTEDGQEQRVRPILVDAPEICHRNSPKDCEPEDFGLEATDFAEEILLGETVYLEQDVSETDRYDRVLSYVYLENGDMYQELLLAEGLAKVAVYPPDTKYQVHLEKLEATAQENKIGIWSN